MRLIGKSKSSDKDLLKRVLSKHPFDKGEHDNSSKHIKDNKDRLSDENIEEKDEFFDSDTLEQNFTNEVKTKVGQAMFLK